MRKINLDTNASFGLAQAVGEKLKLESYLNPSSIHSEGQRARAELEWARRSIAELIDATGARVTFTSGATEANNGVLFHSCFYGNRETFRGNEAAAIVISSVEHPAVIAPAERLHEQGFRLKKITPDDNGEFHAEDFFNACSEETRIVSVMLANNETGQLLPVKEIATLVKSRFPKVLIHTDAVQAIGKIPVSFTDLDVDLLTLTAHKMGGLSGIGAIVSKRDVHIEPMILGGAQELRHRAGTENIVGAKSFGLAAELAKERLKSEKTALAKNAEYFWEKLRSDLSGVHLNNEKIDRIPNTLSIRFDGTRADDLVVALDTEGVLISAAAACSSGKPEPSHVLLALGLTAEEAQQTVRISFHDEYGEGELDYALDAVKRCVERMRG